MKVQITDYTFYPSGNFIHFNELAIDPTLYTLEQFTLITNVTTGEILYQFNDPTKLGELVRADLLLDYDVSAMAATDKLQVFVDTHASVGIETKEGLNRGSMDAPLYVSVEDLFSTFRGIHRELQKINIHLESITDQDIKNDDIIDED